MARLAKRQTPDDDSDDENEGYGVTSTRGGHPGGHQDASPSPSASFASDKENRSIRNGSAAGSKTPGRSIGVQEQSAMSGSERPVRKRRRLSERTNLQMVSAQAPQASQSRALLEQRLDREGDDRYYDPDQPMEERRKVRRGYRDLAKEFADSRAEYMGADSTGILDTVIEANSLLADVKQTSEATLDSRLVVSAGDLASRRAVQLKLGGATPGLDVNEFVNRCMVFMRRGPTERDAAYAIPSTQAPRGRLDDSDAEDNAEGDELNWSWLGQKACLPNNIRPPLPGFLLGPLAIKKRVRKIPEKRARQTQLDLSQAVRPEELKQQDIDRTTNSNIQAICRDIYQRLKSTWAKQAMKAQEDDIDDSSELFDSYGITPETGDVCLFRFAFNPKSFGQTVENLFYISFLIKEGRAEISESEDHSTVLRATEPYSNQEIQDLGVVRQQGVFHLDFDDWREACELYNIEECMIPHRGEAQPGALSRRGWYG